MKRKLLFWFYTIYLQDIQFTNYTKYNVHYILCANAAARANAAANSTLRTMANAASDNKYNCDERQCTRRTISM